MSERNDYLVSATRAVEKHLGMSVFGRYRQCVLQPMLAGVAMDVEGSVLKNRTP